MEKVQDTESRVSTTRCGVTKYSAVVVLVIILMIILCALSDPGSLQK